MCDCKKSCGYILVFDHEKSATGQVYINTATCWVIPLPSNSQYLNGKGIPYKTNDAMLLVVTITLTEGPTPSYTQNNWYIFLLGRCHMASWKKTTNSNFAKQKSVEEFIGNTFFDNFPALKLNKFPYLPWNQNLPEIHLEVRDFQPKEEQSSHSFLFGRNLCWG